MKIPLLLALLCAFAVPAFAQTFDVNFARASDEPPLVKTKFGVYQTPLTTLARLLDSVPLLREAGVRDLRYEMGWGKPDVLAFDQIGGTPANLTYDFSMIDAFAGALKRAQVRPLLALTYDPAPLQTRSEWARWKDVPSNLNAWSEINRAYAAHLKTLGARADYEVWNEPDMPEPGGKMFFSGDANAYGRLFAGSRAGIKSADADALVGGPAAAYDTAFLAPLLKDGAPLGFASIHAYDNAPTHVGFVRGALRNRPDVPIYLTEYASFTDLPADGPQSRAPGAMRFFRDVKTMLKLTDLTRVYWAQWLDAGDAPGMGFVTFDGHRKAIYNALKIYNQMPVDRNFVGAQGADSLNANGLDAMASSDAHCASVVIWNAGETARTATVNLNDLPFANGSLQTFRIDANHASYVDNPASEALGPTQTVAFRGANSRVWRGEIPAQGVVYLQARDATTPPVKPAPKLGDWVRNYHWFADRNAQTYADFDARTGAARLGLNGADNAQIGAVIDDPARRIRVRVEQSNVRGGAAFCALRLDFAARGGGWGRSVSIGNARPQAAGADSLPWGKGGGADQFIAQPAIGNGRPFALDLARLAPRDWDGRRVIVSFVLRDAGREARAKWEIEGA